MPYHNDRWHRDSERVSALSQGPDEAFQSLFPKPEDL